MHKILKSLSIWITLCGLLLMMGCLYLGCLAPDSTSCRADLECGEGSRCLAGKCIALAQCQDDADCGNERICHNGKCEILNQVLCKPGTTRCMGDILETCNADSSGWEALHCGLFHACEKGACVRKPPAPQCGNGILEKGEQCDDGNRVSGDGCSRYCLLERVTHFEPPAENIPPTFILGSRICRDTQKRNSYKDPTSTLYITVSPIVCKLDNKPVIKESDLDLHIKTLNQIFAKAGLVFVMDSIKWEEDADKCEVFFDTESTATLNRYTLPTKVAVFYSRNVYGGTFAIAGFANMKGIVLNASSFGLATTLAHEMGHTFGLDHPHACYHGIETKTNCDTAGDQLCDTPPDPGPKDIVGLDYCSDGKRKDGACTVKNCRTVSCPGGEQPLIDNLMSYYHCGTALTTDQFATVRCVAANDQAKRTSQYKPCQRDDQCENDQSCQSGYCKPSPDLRCQRDNECSRGQSCQNGYCKALPAGACREDADCAPDQICKEYKCQIPTPECTQDSDCGAGKACRDGKCAICTIDGIRATSDRDCCSQQRNDRDICCTGKTCCGPQNNSQTNSLGKCICLSGHEWLTTNDPQDFRCKPINAPTCKKDGEQAATADECCGKERDDKNRCCTSHSCCHAANYAQIAHDGSCQCLQGYQRVSPSDPADVRCHKPNDCSSCCKLKWTLSGHSDLIHSLAFSTDGQVLASASYDKTVRIWNPQMGQLRHTLSGASGAVMSVSIHPQSDELTAGAFDKTVRKWTLAGRFLSSMQLSAPLYGVSYRPDGQQLATVTEKGAYFWTWPANSGMGFASNTFIRNLAYSRDSKLLALATRDKSVQLWTATTRSPSLQQSFTGHTREVFSVSFNHDGSVLASSSAAIKIWSVKSGQLLHTIQAHNRGAYAVLFHPQTSTLFSAGEDHTIQIWDANTGKSIQTLTGHTGPVYTLAISQNGLMLASGSKDNTIKIWQCQ